MPQLLLRSRVIGRLSLLGGLLAALIRPMLGQIELTVAEAVDSISFVLIRAAKNFSLGRRHGKRPFRLRR